MKCPECDYEIDSNAEYCPNCGTPIPNGNNNDNEPRLGKGLVVFIIIGTIFLVVFGVLYYSGHKNDPEYTQTAIEPDSNLIENTASKAQETPKDTIPADSANQIEEEQAKKVFNSIRKTHPATRKVRVASSAGEVQESSTSEGTAVQSAPAEAPTSSHPATAAPRIEPIGEE